MQGHSVCLIFQNYCPSHCRGALLHGGEKMFFQQTETNNYEIDMERVPQHIAIIMDGNGRWAKKRFLPRKAGHKAGAEALERIIEDCRDLGVKHLTVYAFSTENWIPFKTSTRLSPVPKLFFRLLISRNITFLPASFFLSV